MGLQTLELRDLKYIPDSSLEVLAGLPALQNLTLLELNQFASLEVLAGVPSLLLCD